MKKVLLTIVISLFTFSVWGQYPLVSLDSIQYISPQDLALGNDLSYKNGDTVQFEGIVTFNPCYYALSSSGSRIGTFIQSDDPGKPWRGMHVLIENGALQGYTGTLEDLNIATKFLDNFKIGNKVRATGIVSNFSGYTQMLLLPIQSTIQSIGSMPKPHITTIDTFMKNDGAGGQIMQKLTGEQFEGIYIEFQNVTVVDVQPSGNRFFWSLQDAKGNKINVRDMTGWLRNGTNDDHCNGFGSGISVTSPFMFSPPTLGSFLTFMRGVLVEYNGLYYLAPRDTTDIGPIAAAPPVVSDITRNPVVARSNQNVDITAKIIDPDGTVMKTELYYSYGLGNTSFTKLGMASQGNDLYKATIPGPGVDSTFVNFWFRAIGDDDDTTDFPFTNSTSLYYWTLDNGITKISQIQNTPNTGGNSIWMGDSIPSMNIRAVVNSTINTWDLGRVTVQDASAAWSGIFLFRQPGDNLELLNRGDSIKINSASVTEVFGVTYLSDVDYTLLGQGTLPTPITGIDPDSINMQVFDYGEAYEGVFLRFDNSTVVDTNADFNTGGSNFGEFVINTKPGASTGMRVDDYSNELPMDFNVDSLTQGQVLTYVQGPLYFSFSNFKLTPRNLSDVGGFNTNYPKVINSFAFLTLNPQVFLDIDQNTKMITTPSPLPQGTDVSTLVPTIDYSGSSLVPPSGQAQDFKQIVDYTVTAPIDDSKSKYSAVVEVVIGINELQFNAFQLYPNPASKGVLLSFDSKEAMDLNILVRDLAGNRIMQQSMKVQPGYNEFPVEVSQLPAGIYLIEMISGNQKTVRKISVMR
jgi:Secretion system C-terminal sorting domain